MLLNWAKYDKLPKALVDDFDTICTTKGYQKRDDAIHDLIAVHVEKEKSN